MQPRLITMSLVLQVFQHRQNIGQSENVSCWWRKMKSQLITNIIKGLCSQAVFWGGRSNEVKHLCAKIKNAAHASCLYDNNILTTWHCLFAVCCLFFIWDWDIRARRMWLLDMMWRRKQHVEYYCLHQEKEKEWWWRHQRLSEKLRF